MKTKSALLLGPLFLGLSACALMPGQDSSLSTTGPYGESEAAPTPVPPATTTAAPIPAPTVAPTPIPPAAATPATIVPPAHATVESPTQHQSAAPAAPSIPAPSSVVAPSPERSHQDGIYQEISFTKASAEVTPQTLDTLRQTAVQLQQVLAQDQDMRVGIVSYTDVAGEGKDAALIGDRRAWGVNAALQADGLTAQQLRVVIPPLKDTTPALAGKVLIRLQPKN